MRYEDLPADAIEWAKISSVDLIGCALAAADEEAPQIAERCWRWAVAAAARA